MKLLVYIFHELLLLGFKRTMSDELDRIAVWKKSVLFLILLKLFKTMHFFLISSNYMNAGVTFDLFMTQKKSSMEKIMRLILEEIIMSYKHRSDGQMYSLLQFFFDIEKIRLNWRLDSSLTDYVLLIFILIPLW